MSASCKIAGIGAQKGLGIIVFPSNGFNGGARDELAWGRLFATIELLAGSSLGSFAIVPQIHVINMPGVFNKFGIHFQYPENWTLETDEATPGRQMISLYSPGGAFWTVALTIAEDEPRELAKAALDILKREYDELDSESVEETVAGVDLVGFDVNFYCLDLTNTAWIRAGIKGTNRSYESRVSPMRYLILCQAEDREFDQISPVFRAMTISLLSESH
jgi:hypothetical protein